VKTYDAIVVGAGVNGLTCAAYLARAGRTVLVLEARDKVGGMAELANTVGRLSPVVARELGLRRHGLRLVQPGVRVFAPQPDGRAVTLWTDVARTAAELADHSLVGRADADAYVGVDQRMRSLSAALAPIVRSAPADLASASLGRRVSSLARLARVDQALMRALPMAARDLVSEWFQADALRAAVAARGILYTALGPRAPGTAAVLLTDSAGNSGGLAGQSVFARGGPTAVAAALASAAREHGTETRTAARVARVRHDRSANRVLGVTLADGEDIDAPLVVSTLDPQTTLLDLLEPEVLGPRLSWRASNVRQRGVTARVELALGALPSFPAADGDEPRLRGRILIAPSLRYLDLAARAARHGATADEPLIEATIPTLIDPARADGWKKSKKVRHVLSAVVQAVAPDAAADDVRDRALRTLEMFAPGLSELVIDARVTTPLEIEREYGARGGHPMHAEVALDQWFEWRPLHGLGRYRMPIDGYYLAGAGAHPGGGVTGHPGRLAALEALSEPQPGRRRLTG
jgi:phytoene dehydrogenase-like protein